MVLGLPMVSEKPARKVFQGSSLRGFICSEPGRAVQNFQAM